MKTVWFLLFLVIVPFLAKAAPITQYSALITTTQAKESTTAKFHFDSGKIRVESKIKGTDTVSIVRPDISKFYSVLPDKKTYIEVAITAQDVEMMAPYTEKTKFTGIGTEKLSGIECDKYQIESGGLPMFLWVNQKTQEPVLMQTEDGSIKTEWKDVKPGAQAANLFEPPAGFEKIDMKPDGTSATP